MIMQNWATALLLVASVQGEIVDTAFWDSHTWNNTSLGFGVNKGKTYGNDSTNSVILTGRTSPCYPNDPDASSNV